LLFDRMSGLDEKQLDEVEERVAELLEEPWDKGTGRPREITFREALVITCGYMRQNIVEDVWADIFDVDQSTISRIITFLTRLVEQAAAEFRPTPEEAAEATRGAVAPVERAVASLKTWRILFTDYRRPLKTFMSSFRAAIGLYFFKESFA